jgi:hypothetical protein
MSHQLEEKELLRRIGQLPREIPPRRDPWPLIAARIAQPRAARVRTRHWLPLAAAASVVAALVLGLLLGPRLAEPPAAGGLQVTQEEQAPESRGTHTPAFLAGSEAEYQAAFREFIAVGRDRSSLSPRTIETIETGWADLRATETELAAALATHPDDRFLNTRMLELRARQLGFLRQIASLDQSNRRLTI